MAATLDLGLQGAVCAVTGAASGIGRAVATTLARYGAHVAILDRNEGAAAETLRLVEREGGRGIALGCDVADAASVDSACMAVEKLLGPARILVNSAAVLKPGGLATLPLADWQLLLSINLTGYFICAQRFARGMIERREGCLIHVSSVMAESVSPFGGAYSIAKSGVKLLSRQLAVELGPSGIRSNCVNPGLVRTPLSEANYRNDDFRTRREAAIPLRRISTGQDIADAVLFLASPLAGYVNGADIMVDGGFLANLMSLVPRIQNPDDQPKSPR
jgi:NAD(P)-dependent dehydrogenase (short-subunit alcohol dehydrogenase family)